MKTPPAMRALLRVLLVFIFSAPLAGIGADKPTAAPAIRSELAPRSLLLDVAAAGQRLVAVGEQGHIIFSDDGGAGWTHATVPASLMLTSVCFATPQQGWAVGHEGLILTTADGGENWSIQLDGRAIAERQVQQATARVVELQAALADLDEQADREEAEFAVEDAQFVLEDAEAVLADGITTPLLGVACFADSQAYAFGAYGLLLQTTDAGENWALISSRIENPADYHFYGMARLQSGALIIAGEAGSLHRSRDDGETWQRLRAGYEGSLFGVIAPTDGSAIVFGLRGNIFRSTDEGDTWRPIRSPSQATLLGGTQLPGGISALVGAGGTLLLSHDQGQTFEIMSTGSRRPFSSVYANGAGGLLLVGFGGVSVVDYGRPDGAGD